MRKKYLGEFWSIVTAIVCVHAVGMVGYADDMAWVPDEAMGSGLAEDGNVSILPEITITSTPKATADISKFTNIYEIELERFGIYNDGTHADETTKGLNEALQHAKTVGANRIVFPKGTYLISENDPIIFDHKNTVVDLNGAVLQIRKNGLKGYSVVQVLHGAENFRLTNGTIRGDRDIHDYESVPGTHEWGGALSVMGGDQLEFDHLILENATGDGMNSSSTGTRNRDELLTVIKHSIVRKELEPGAFSETGEKVNSEAAFRTIEPYDLTNWGGEFEVGHLGGYQGFPHIKGRVYEIVFLDQEQKFLEKRQALQYRKLEVPEGAKYVHFQFNQSEISGEPAHYGGSTEWLVRVTNVRPSQDVHFHHNLLRQNRRLGMAYCGGQRWVIEDNRFEENGGTAPGYGVDFEDGWELVYDVVFRRNSFKGNDVGDLVICAGTEILVEDNVFENIFAVHGRTHNYTVRNNEFKGRAVSVRTRTGMANFHDNKYTGQRVSFSFDGKGVADGIVRKEGQKVSTPPLLLKNETFEGVKKVEGTYMNFENSTFKDTKFIVGDSTQLVRFKDSTFDNAVLEIEEKGPEFLFVDENNQGELQVNGPGVKRQKITKK